MKEIVNFFRGSARLRISGPFPERFLNICGANGVGFWGVEWVDEHTLLVTVPRSALRRALELGEQALCQCQITAGQGVPAFLARFKRRYGFLAGLFCALVAVSLLSHVVLVIDVTGNETVSSQVILQELREAGLKPGVFAPTLNERSVAHRVLMADTRLCYMAVNLHGIRAEVIVREAIPAPEVADRTTPSNLIAAEDGVVTRMEIYAGVKQTQVDDVVKEGEVLVSGRRIYKKPDTDEIFYSGYTPSIGKVWAETWQQQEGIFPLHWGQKTYTGREKRKYRLKLLGHTIKFYQNGGISFDMYDKITVTKQLTLPGGLKLPVWWMEEHCREYQVSAVAQEEADRREWLEETLTARLSARLGEEDEILTARFAQGEGEGTLRLTLTAQCSQQIARQEAILTEGNDAAND